MSDLQPTTPQSTDATPADSSPRPKRGRWKRRLLKTLFAIVLIAVVLRIGVFFLLALTLRKVANFYDLDLTYGRQEITMLGGDAGLWEVKVARRGDTSPFLEADYVHGNLSIMALLRTNIEIWRLEADGVTLDLTRTAEGHVPLVDLVMAQINNQPVTNTQSSNEPLQLESPFKIDALRLHRFCAKITDLAVSPAFRETVYADLRVSNLRHPQRQTTVEADLWSDSTLAAMRFSGSGTASGQAVRLDASFRGNGLNLGPIAAYLAPFGIHPVANGVDWNGKLRLTTDAGPTPTSLRAAISLQDVSAQADSREVVFVKTVDVAARSIDSTGIALSTLRIDGARVHAERASNGRLRFAGIELASPPPATQPATLPEPGRQALTTRPVPATRPATHPAGAPAPITLDELVLTNLQASFGDEALPQPTTIRLLVDELKTQKVGTDAQGRSFLPISGKLRAPGIASTISVNGRLHPFQAPFGADLQIAAQGVKPDALRPYLELLGVTSTLSDAKFTAGVEAAVEMLEGGSARASFQLKDLVFQDAAQLLKLPLVAVRSLRADAAAHRFDLGEMSIVGPEFSFARDADGGLEAIGFRYRPVASAASAAQPSSTQPAEASIALTPPSPDDLPIITLDKLDWSGVKITAEDRSTAEPSRFVIDDIGAQLKGIVFSLDRDSSASGNGEIRAWASIPGLLGRIDVGGDTSSSNGQFSAKVNIRGKQISLASLDSYLAPLGVKPTMKDGSVEASTQLVLSGTGGSNGEEIEAVLGGNVELRDANHKLLSLPSAEAKGVIVHPTWIEIRSLNSAGARVQVVRNSDGSLEVCGLRLANPSESSTPTPNAGTPLVPIPRLPIPIAIHSGTLSACIIDLEDRMFDPSIKTGVALAGSVSNVRVDQRLGAERPEHPSVFDLKVSLGESDETAVSGWFRLERDSIAAAAEVRGTGLTTTPFAPYLPAGIIPTFGGAAVNAKAEVSVRNLDGGKQQVDLTLQDISFRQGDDTLAKLDRFVIESALIDLPNNRIDIGSIQSQGANAMAGLGVDSSLRLPGVRIDPSIEPVKENAKPDAPIEVSADGAAVTAQEAALRLAEARRTLPQVTINKLEVGLDRAGIAIDAMGADSELALEGLSLRNVEPIQIGGAQAASLPPVRLRLQTALTPIAKSVSIDLEATPFATEARFAGKLNVEQIRGAGLTELVPQLAELVDGSALTQGTLSAALDATLRVNRRTPTEFDLGRGFDGEVKLTDVAYRDGNGNELLAGLESITLEGLRVQPAFAGGTVKLLTINKPLLRARRDAQGIQLLGWTIKLPAGTSTTQPSAEEAKPAIASTAVEKQQTSEELPPEFKIDRLIVNGCDLVVRDDSVEPPLLVPVNTLDVEVRGLSNRALVQDRTVRFSVLVGTDKVELPSRAQSGQPAAAPTELRPLLSQVTATGTLKLYPALEGYVKAAVNGFEMQSLIGEAKALGITLGDGIFDGTFDARFRDGGNLDLKTKLVVTDLKMSEQPNGFMQRTFKLPAPIDSAIGFAEDTSGSITFPLSAQIRSGELNVGSVVGSVVGGVSQVFLTAIASAPAKLLQGVFGGGDTEAKPIPPKVIAFLPGDASLEPPLREALDQILSDMRRDSNLVVTLAHRFSAPDAKRAGTLASPTREQIDQMTGDLRLQRVVMINKRATMAANLSAQIASGVDAGDATARLREMDRQIVANDDALERILEQTRPGAELQGDRRMKAAAVDVANARLAAVRSYLEASRLPGIADRISVANPRFEVDSTLPEGGVVSIQPTAKKRAS